MSNFTDHPSGHVIPFPLVPAGELRKGDLLHLGGSSYVLVAQAQTVGDRVEVTLYDGDRPQNRFTRFQPGESVRVAYRDLIRPSTAGGHSDDTPERARRRGAAFALMDLIRARSGGPVTGIDEEIDRIRGRDSVDAQSPLRIIDAPIPDLPGVLARQRADGHLILDVDHPAVRAIIALFNELKASEGPDGGWNGGDTVDIVCHWFERMGIDPNRSAGRLEARFARSVADPIPIDSVAAIAEPGNLDGPDDIDLDRVAELVRDAGVECVIDTTPGSGVAVLLAGPPTTEPAWAFPWAAQAGPGRVHGNRPSSASTVDLAVGPDDGGEVRPTSVRSVGALTEPQIAALIVAQTRINDPAAPLSCEELAAIGLDCGACQR